MDKKKKDLTKTGFKALQIIKSLQTKKNQQLDLMAYDLGDAAPCKCQQYISTGLKKLDIILSNRAQGGGYPVGKITTISGQQGTGKTLLALLAARYVVDKGGIIVWIDTQNALDVTFMQSFGIPKQKVVYVQLNTVQAMFRLVQQLGKRIRQKHSNKLVLFVIDSVAGLSTQAEVRGNVGDANYGIAARLLSQGLRKYVIMWGKMRVAVLFLNQLRYKMNAGLFQDPLSAMYGGKAIPFYSSMLIKLRKAGKIRVNDQVVGNNVSLTVQKNRLAPPWRKSKFQVIYDHGVTQVNHIMQTCKNMKVIKSGGAWWTWQHSGKKFQKPNFAAQLKKPQNEKVVWDKLKQKLVISSKRYLDADNFASGREIVDQQTLRNQQSGSTK